MSTKSSRPGANGAAGQIMRGVRSNVDTTAIIGQDPRVEPLDAEDRRIAALLAELYDAGYRIAVQCRTCGSWLAHPESVARHQGPKCAAREGVRR